MAKRDLSATADSRATQPVDLEERRLMARHLSGDPSAFVELVQRFERPVYGYLVRSGFPAQMRDDLFQEVFLKIHRAAAQYTPERALRPWLFTIVTNTVRSHYRRETVRRLVQGDGEPSHAPAPTPSGAEVSEALETARFLNETLMRLPMAQREVLILRCLEHLSEEEVAQVLELPLGTVKTHLHRARASLAEALSRRRLRAAREVAS